MPAIEQKFPSQMNKIQEKRLSGCIGLNTKTLATMGLYLIPNVLFFLQKKKKDSNYRHAKNQSPKDVNPSTMCTV